MKKDVLEKSTIWDYSISEIFGIILMVIPCLICIFVSTKSKLFPWKSFNIKPCFESAMCAAAFYVSLIIRYDFFKKDNLGHTIVSSVQTFVNMLALSGLLASVFNTNNKLAMPFMVSAIVLGWLGMRTIAGYSWILFVAAAVCSVGNANKIGEAGAIFIITMVLSLLLQVPKISDIQMFIDDFKVPAKNLSNSVKEEISAAADDAGKRIDSAKNIINAASVLGNKKSDKDYIESRKE